MSFFYPIGSKVLGLKQPIDEAEFLICKNQKKFELSIEIKIPTENDIVNFKKLRSIGITKAKHPFLIWKFKLYPIVTTCKVEFDPMDIIYFGKTFINNKFNKLEIYLHDKSGWIKAKNKVNLDRSFIDNLWSRWAKSFGNTRGSYRNIRNTRTSLSIEEIWRRAEEYEF